MREMENHECIERFKTKKIDFCTGEGWNKCYGINPMVLEVWFMDTYGTEMHEDNWIKINVDYYPFCGVKGNKGKIDAEK